MFTVSALRIATSLGRAPTIRAIGSRSASSMVNHGRSVGEPCLDAAARPGVELRLDGRRTPSWLEPERLAGEVDRRGRAAPSGPSGSRKRSR